MKIELKNVKINEAFSEETICFKADVFVNGKKIAYASNDGRGGCTFYNAYDGQRDRLSEVENFCKTLPIKSVDFNGGSYEFDQNLESVIDDLVFEKENEKEQKKIAKLFECNIVYGKKNGLSYTIIGFKGKPKFSELGKRTAGKIAIQNLYNRIKSELKVGEEIFNTNLEEFLK